MGVVAQFTEPCNAMVSPEHRQYLDARAAQPGVSMAVVVREALDLLIETRPLPTGDSVSPPA